MKKAAGAASKASSKTPAASEAAPEVDPDAPDENDPNRQKFIPDIIHFDKTKH